MTDFINPLGRQRPTGFSEHVSKIKSWTRTALKLDEDTVVSVNELACYAPDCPPKQVVVLILREKLPPQKFSVHKALLETSEDDILLAAEAREEIQAD